MGRRRDALMYRPLQGSTPHYRGVEAFKLRRERRQCRRAPYAMTTDRIGHVVVGAFSTTGS